MIELFEHHCPNAKSSDALDNFEYIRVLFCIFTAKEIGKKLYLNICCLIIFYKVGATYFTRLFKT